MIAVLVEHFANTGVHVSDTVRVAGRDIKPATGSNGPRSGRDREDGHRQRPHLARLLKANPYP